MNRWFIVKSKSDYERYKQLYPEYCKNSRCITSSQGVYGIRGEVLVLNDADEYLDNTARETLYAYKLAGIVKVVRVYL